MGRKKLTDEEKAARKDEREKNKEKTVETAQESIEKIAEKDERDKEKSEKKEETSEKPDTSKSKDFDSSKTESFGSARELENSRHAQKSEISDIKIEIEEKIKIDEEPKKKIEIDEKIKIDEKAEKKEEKKASNTLIPIEDYVKAGCYIGTKVITPDMRKFVYRRRADGIAIINTNVIDQKIGEAAKLISEYKPEDWILVCKREAGWRALKLFSELTGVRVFTKKYPAGIITNINLPDFFETKLVFVCDPWLDKNAMNDAVNVKKRIFSICDTNNLARQADFVIPANNKSNKSLGVIFYILAREYMKARGISKKMPEMEDFIGEKLGELEPKKSKKIEQEKQKDIEKIEGILRLDEKER